MRATHTLPNLLHEMADLGIVHSILHAIDYPLISCNAETWLALAAGRRDVTVFGSVHPFGPFMATHLDRQVKKGARGVKVHPAVQLVGPEHPRAQRLYQLCGERRLPVFFHCGPVGIEPEAGRRRSQVNRYEPALAEHPETTFVLGHSGALQWEAGLDLACRYPNAWLDLASQSLGAIRTILERGPADRLVLGSDWPFYHQATAVAKVLLATEGDPALRRRVLHDNAARLLASSVSFR
jgi:uncharacterized protein